MQKVLACSVILRYNPAMETNETTTTTTREITFEEMFGSEADFQDWQDWRAACADADMGVPTFDESR
jgi:hypothetical protein